MSIISVKNVGYNYIQTDENDEVVENIRALNHVNFNIDEGSFICVLGHNGSGKSTLAKLLNALYTPTDGDVIVFEKNTRDEENILEIRKSSGMVFQNPDNQIIASVVEEDVGFGPENIGVPTEEIWDRVTQSLETVGMSAYRLSSPNRLSGGQKQRVAIAGVLAMKPRCIILDEPTAMLDPDGRDDVINTIIKLNKEEHITIILITHFMEEVVNADMVYVMNDGEIAMSDTPREIFSKVEEIKDFGIDVPQITQLAHILRKDGLDLPTGILSREELVSELIKLKKESK